MLGSTYQLVLPLNVEFRIPKNDPVRLLRHIIEGMDLSELYRTYSHLEKNQASPRQLLEILTYANMRGIFSSRDIEKACSRDINFMYLLEGTHAPDHATIARFKSLHLTAAVQSTFAAMDEKLAEIGELSLANLFVDGTKIESVANKYTFVWKRAVTKQLQKLLDKIPDFVAQTEAAFGLPVRHGTQLQLRHLKRLRRQLKRIQYEEQLEFVHGSGKRKAPLQRALEQLDSYIHRLKDYYQKLHIAGTRNSFSKTDHDATFMRMKEDYMRNGQLKPGYNIQFGVDAEYIVWVTAGPQPTDTPTLIPFLQDFENHVHQRYRNVIADAGYESEENYLYLDEHGQQAYIKPSNYEISQKKKYRQDIGRRENMAYSAEEDSYTCANGKKLRVTGTRKQKTKTGYVVTKTQYTCEGCTDCPLKSKCIHGHNSKVPMEERSKHFEVSKQFQEKRAEALEHIVTEKGIELRVNRSIQSEGTFGNIKENMSFRRFRSRGTENVLVESMLVAMAHNILKLHHKIQGRNQGRYLFPIQISA